MSLNRRMTSRSISRRSTRGGSTVRSPSNLGSVGGSSLGGGGGGEGSEGGTVVGHVGRQRDGLPRLPSHLEFEHYYNAEDHCPVCSLDEGEEHPQGAVPSHAATLLSKSLEQAPADNPVRAIDEHGMALLESLRRPKDKPSWWGARHADKQAKAARVLESSAMHYSIIALTLLDLAVVVTELIMSSIYPVRDEAPHAVHSAEEVLSWTSITILCIFVVELLSKLLVFGHTYFTRSWWHMADAVVVVASLTLELTLRGVAQEVASLLVFFRLWRLLRVMHGVAEAMEVHHEEELRHHHSLVHGLQKDLASEHRRVRQLEREMAALSGAATAAGLDVASVLRLAAMAASQPDDMLAEAVQEGGKSSGSDSGGAGSRGGGSRHHHHHHRPHLHHGNRSNGAQEV